MKVYCIFNDGEAFRDYQMPPGYFTSSQFGVEVGKEYLVMGVLLSEGLISYLIDDASLIQLCPFQLFEIVDSKCNKEWHFRSFKEEDAIYPYRQAIWGYYELCFEDNHFDRLVEQDPTAISIYFKEKERSM